MFGLMWEKSPLELSSSGDCGFKARTPYLHEQWPLQLFFKGSDRSDPRRS
jgi:hypothetical protein